MTSPQLQVREYGPQDMPVQVMLLCQHDGDGKKFLEAHPEVIDLIAGEREDFERFMRLERDVGTGALAHAIANQLNDVRTRVVEVTVPRSLLDVNRIWEDEASEGEDPKKLALRNVFSDSERAAHIFLPLYCATMAKIEQLIHKSEVFLDLHSMAPFNPSSYEHEKPGKLLEYLDRWIFDPDYRSVLRPLGFPIGLNGGDMLVDRKLLGSFEGVFGESHIPFGRNNPYALTPRIMTTEHLKLQAGLCLDIPKSRLVIGNALQVQSSLDRVVADQEKIEKLAQIVAMAIRRSLL